MPKKQVTENYRKIIEECLDLLDDRLAEKVNIEVMRIEHELRPTFITRLDNLQSRIDLIRKEAADNNDIRLVRNELDSLRLDVKKLEAMHVEHPQHNTNRCPWCGR